MNEEAEEHLRKAEARRHVELGFRIVSSIITFIHQEVRVFVL
jgi:hypothetical protein